MTDFNRLAEQEFTALAQATMHHATPDTATRTDALEALNHRLMWLETLCRELHALLESVPFEPVQDEDAEKNWYDRVEAAHQRYKALFAQERREPS